jgi:hypothetical protein
MGGGGGQGSLQGEGSSENENSHKKGGREHKISSPSNHKPQ